VSTSTPPSARDPATLRFAHDGRPRVALATTRALPEPDVDEPILLHALRAAGVDACVHPWEDGPAPEADLVVIRSTWNYLHHVDDFVAWARAVGPRLLNPPELVAWNVDKRYLVELAAEGLSVVPTTIIEQGTQVDAATLRALVGGARAAVVKPVISAGSFLTQRFAAAAIDGALVDLLNARLAERAMMLQPYVPSVETHGERALVHVDGALLHAARKSPRFDADAEDVRPAGLVGEAERRFAAEALALGQRRTATPLLYARVDLALDAHGAPMLMELELVEPSLFFADHPGSEAHLVAAILARLARR
jgi:hypothetical protein